MIIPHRKPCIEAQLRVKGDEQELKNIINDLLRNKKDIGATNINILPSGNAAICVSSKIIKDIYGESNVLVPDMGGWKGFITYSKMFNLNPIKIHTELGIIDPSTLDECTKKYQAKGLFLTSLAGYLAPQPLKEIKKVCEENEILFVEDASGKVGGDCGYGDIVVCSTGVPKIINCEYGGFIGIGKKIKDQLKELGKLEELKSFLKTYKTFNIFGSMKEETLRARRTYKKCVYLSDIIKEEMENAYFEGKEGVSVFLEYENPNEVLKNFEKNVKLDNGKSPLTKCPKYERILRKGVVVEIKKMDVQNLDDEEILKILDFLKK